MPRMAVKPIPALSKSSFCIFLDAKNFTASRCHHRLKPAAPIAPCLRLYAWVALSAITVTTIADSWREYCGMVCSLHESAANNLSGTELGVFP